MPPESVILPSPAPVSSLPLAVSPSCRGRSRSPTSERSAGDGGSDKEGHYSSLVGDDPYSVVRRPDGQEEESCYACAGMGLDTGYESLRTKTEPNYETLGIESSQVKEQVYQTLEKHSAEYEMSPTGAALSESESSSSERTVLRLSSSQSPDKEEQGRSTSSPSSPDSDVMPLYARVDRSKKKSRNSDGSNSPQSQENNNPASPTKTLIEKFNNIGQHGEEVDGFQDNQPTVSGAMCSVYSGETREGLNCRLQSKRSLSEKTLWQPLADDHKNVPSLTLQRKIPNRTDPHPVEGMREQRNVRPSTIHRLVSADQRRKTTTELGLRSDENEEHVGEQTTSILKRNFGRLGWQTANI